MQILTPSVKYIETQFYLEDIADAKWDTQTITCFGNISERSSPLKKIVDTIFSCFSNTSKKPLIQDNVHVLAAAKKSIKRQLAALEDEDRNKLDLALLERVKNNFNDLVRKNKCENIVELKSLVKKTEDTPVLVDITENQVLDSENEESSPDESRDSTTALINIEDNTKKQVIIQPKDT